MGYLPEKLMELGRHVGPRHAADPQEPHAQPALQGERDAPGRRIVQRFEGGRVGAEGRVPGVGGERGVGEEVGKGTLKRKQKNAQDKPEAGRGQGGEDEGNFDPAGRGDFSSRVGGGAVSGGAGESGEPEQRRTAAR